MTLVSRTYRCDACGRQETTGKPLPPGWQQLSGWPLSDSVLAKADGDYCSVECLRGVVFALFDEPAEAVA